MYKLRQQNLKQFSVNHAESQCLDLRRPLCTFTCEQTSLIIFKFVLSTKLYGKRANVKAPRAPESFRSNKAFVPRVYAPPILSLSHTNLYLPRVNTHLGEVYRAANTRLYKRWWGSIFFYVNK